MRGCQRYKTPARGVECKVMGFKNLKKQRMDQDRQSLKVDMRDLLETGFLRTASMALILDDVDE